MLTRCRISHYAQKSISLGLLIGALLGAYLVHGQGARYNRSAKKINKIVDEWMEGEVTFQDGKTIVCELSYNPLLPEGLLKFIEGDKMLTGTAFNIESFTYYDYDASTDHTYFSLPITNRNRVFAQLLYEGSRYAILGRKSAFLKKYWGTDSMFGSPTVYHSEVKLQYQHILFDFKTGNSYTMTRKEVPRIMEDKKKEIKAFIRANKLKFRDTEDYIAVVKEYERLTR